MKKRRFFRGLDKSKVILGVPGVILSVILLVSFFLFIPPSWATCPPSECPTDAPVTGAVALGEASDPGGEPTLITLVFFTATGLDGEVLLKWETASEIDNAGFNIWRSTKDKKGKKNKKGKNKKEEYIKINPNLIPAEGSPIQGATYTYTDTDVRNGVTYYYKLEDIDTHGTSTYHGKDACTYGVDPDCEPVRARPHRERPGR